MSERIEKRIAEMLATTPRGAHGGALCGAADELLAAGDVDGALECFDRALRLDVRSTRAWTGRATVLGRRSRFGEALGCINRALDERAGYAPALILKAELLLKAGRRPEALECCLEPLAADSELPDHWVRRGRLFEELGRADDAAESYATALAMEDLAVAWSHRAELLTRQGKLEGAAHDFARAVAAEPGQVDAWYRLACTYRELAKTSDEQWALERFFALSPEEGPQTAGARRMLAALEARAPQIERPLRAPVAPVAPAAPEVPELGIVYRRPSQTPERDAPQPFEGEPPELPPASRRLEAPPAPAPSESFDDELELTGNAAEAAPPASRPFYLDEIDALHADGKHIEALRRIGPILTRNPDLLDGWLSQAKILIALGELDVAVTSLEHMIRLDRRNVTALSLMAACWQSLRRDDRAIEILEQLLAIAVKSGDAELVRETRARLAELV